MSLALIRKKEWLKKTLRTKKVISKSLGQNRRGVKLEIQECTFESE